MSITLFPSKTCDTIFFRFALVLVICDEKVLSIVEGGKITRKKTRKACHHSMSFSSALISSCETGETVCFDPKVKIKVPDERNGLYAIDTLDPDMVYF